MLSEQERRHQSRFRVARTERLRGELEVASEHALVQVADLSLGGAGLILAEPRLELPARDVLLGLQGAAGYLGESPVDVVHIPRNATSGLLGVRFRQPKESFLQTICRYLVDHHCQREDRPHFLASPHHFELVRDPSRVRGLLSFLQREHVALQIFGPSGMPSGRLLVESVDGDLLSGSCQGSDPSVLRAGETYRLVAATFTSAYVFVATLRRLDASRLCFALTEEVLGGSTRRHFRLTLHDDYPVSVEFIHPHVPGKLVRKLAIEVGPGGLSFELDVEQDLLAPGTAIDSALLRLPDGRALSCRCLVRHVWRRAAGFACGVECLGFSEGDRWLWMRSLLQRAHPRVVPVDAQALPDVWDVFDRSGYLDEKPVELMQAMREPFRESWTRLANSRGDSQCWLLRDEGQAVATVSMSRIYGKTWLFHQLGADLFHFDSKQQNLDAMAQIALRTAPQWVAGMHRDGFALTYFNTDKHFNRWSWFDFFEQHNGRGELDSERVRLWDVRVDSRRIDRRHRGIQVGASTDEERRWIAHDLLSRDGPLVHAAFDFEPDTIALSHLVERADGTALDRRRELFVARSAQRIEGYAIVESAATGVNIFSLYDTCRVVLTGQGGGVGAERARDALLARAHSHFLQRGCPSFLYLAGPGDAPLAEQDQASGVEVFRTVMTLQMLLSWAESVDRVWTQSARSGR